MNPNCPSHNPANEATLHRPARNDGLIDFSGRVVPSLLKPGLRVLDVGGGRAPCIAADLVRRLGLHVVGLDIAEDELRNAPPGAYHETIVADVTKQAIAGSFDLIISRAVLEHVNDTRAAIGHLAGALAEGGVMAHFIPCRYAPFAVLNRFLGNALARRILWGIYPQRKGVGGFKAYYDRCVPSQMASLCRGNGMEIVELTPCFESHYFEFLAPLHFLDQCRQTFMRKLGLASLAETFIIVARKPGCQESNRCPSAA